jgi:hypothetical protein
VASNRRYDSTVDDGDALCYNSAKGDEMNSTMKAKAMAKRKGRPEKAGGEGTVVRIAGDVVAKAKYLAAQRGIPASDYLSELLRPVIEREFRKAGKELMDDNSDSR